MPACALPIGPFCVHTVMFEQVMRSLRWHVQQLEENEMIESMLLQGSRVALETQPSSDNVDAIMQSMMGPPLSNADTDAYLTLDEDSPRSAILGLRLSSEDTAHDTVGMIKYVNKKGKGRAV